MTHAVVIGGSVAGLLAAAALAQSVDGVTILERKQRPGRGESLAPQGRMTHVLLLGGANAIEEVLPGFQDDAAARGVPSVRADQGLWWNGGYRQRFFDTDTAPFGSRVMIEEIIRDRVEAIDTIDVRYGTGVEGLIGDSSQVRGVSTTHGTIEADVVVDASGRGSHLERWLEAIGAVLPPVEEVKVDVAYAGAIVPAPPGSTDRHKYLVCQSMFPDNPRIGLALEIENDQWSIVMGGYHGDRPPTDPRGLLTFAETLSMPELPALLEEIGPIDDIQTYRFASNRRRRFEKIRVPAGLLPIGDSVCSFNPVYGQGMSVAAQEAAELQRAVRRSDVKGLDTNRLIGRFGKIVDGPWRIAADADLGHPQTEGHRSPNAVDKWIGRILHATTVDPQVARTLMRVTSLVDPPRALFGPGTIGRTLRAARRRPVEEAAAEPVG